VAIAAKRNTQGDGPRMRMEGVVFKLPKPQKAVEYALSRRTNLKYDLTDMSFLDDDANCGTFAIDVAKAGGSLVLATFCNPLPIALITSFAAREVFVGTMATLYSVGEDADENSETLRNKMHAAKRSDGTPVYTKATGFSLMVFYLLAMQCMSTLAVVKRETGSWKWPIIQLVYMTVIAYVLSFIAYKIFS
jgi:hypothetical protein